MNRQTVANKINEYYQALRQPTSEISDQLIDEIIQFSKDWNADDPTDGMYDYVDVPRDNNFYMFLAHFCDVCFNKYDFDFHMSPDEFAENDIEWCIAKARSEIAKGN